MASLTLAAEALDQMHDVLWPAEPGSEPSAKERRERIDLLARTLRRWGQLCATPNAGTIEDVGDSTDAGSIEAPAPSEQEDPDGTGVLTWLESVERRAESHMLLGPEFERLHEAALGARAAWSATVANAVTAPAGQTTYSRPNAQQDRYPAMLLALIYQEFTGKAPGRLTNSYADESDKRGRYYNSPFYRFARAALTAANLQFSDAVLRDAVQWVKRGDIREREGERKRLWRSRQ